MDNVEGFLLLTWILMALSGVFFYRAIAAIQDFIIQRRYSREYAALEPATLENTCKGPHKWDKIKLALSGLPVDQYIVCVECGKVSGQESWVKLNGPALKMYQNELKLRDEASKLQSKMDRKRQEELDRLMNNMVKRHYEELGGDPSNIAMLQQFFRKTVLEVDSLYARLNKEVDSLNKEIGNERGRG